MERREFSGGRVQVVEGREPEAMDVLSDFPPLRLETCVQCSGRGCARCEASKGLETSVPDAEQLDAERVEAKAQLNLRFGKFGSGGER